MTDVTAGKPRTLDATGTEAEAREPLIRVRGVTKSFGGAAALKDVDLDIHPGEIHALMGMNGAGKSTLVQVLSGVHHADSGEIAIDGHVRSGLTVRTARRLGVSFVPQRRELAMGLGVAENVMLGDLPRRRGVVIWSQVEAEARTALSDLGIDIDVRRSAGELTVAEQTMVEVAREVRRGGRVLILDEPTACLSAEAANRIRELVRRLRDEGVAIVYISHYIDEVMAIADRVTVLRDGAVVRTAPAADFDAGALVRGMVGRDVVSHRPERPAPREEFGLTVSGLTDGRWVRDFSTRVRKGEIVAVLGPAGDAQSRLFDLLSGRRRPQSGEMHVDGKHVRFGRVADSLGSGLRCVTGDRRALGLLPGLSVDENLMLADDRLHRRWVHRRGDLARRASSRRTGYGVVTLGGDPPVGSLSGGNQQKVLLGKWLDAAPVACFLEDPTNGVDVAAVADIHTLIDDLASRGTAVLIASSSAEEAMRLADRILVVRAGHTVADHATTAITRDELVASTLGGASQ